MVPRCEARARVAGVLARREGGGGGGPAARRMWAGKLEERWRVDISVWCVRGGYSGCLARNVLVVDVVGFGHPWRGQHSEKNRPGGRPGCRFLAISSPEPQTAICVRDEWSQVGGVGTSFIDNFFDSWPPEFMHGVRSTLGSPTRARIARRS